MPACECLALAYAEMPQPVQHVIVEVGNFLEVSVEGTLTPALGMA